VPADDGRGDALDLDGSVPSPMLTTLCGRTIEIGWKPMHAAQHIKSPILHETDLLAGRQSLRQSRGHRTSDGFDRSKAISALWAPDTFENGR